MQYIPNLTSLLEPLLKRTGLLALAIALPLFGQQGEPVTIPQPDELSACCTPNPFLHPWQLRGNYLRTGRARFDDQDLEDQRFRFQQWDVGTAYLAPTGLCTGVAPTVGYRQTHIGWSDSPFLDTERFDELYLGVLSFTRCIPCWFWRVGIGWWQQLYRLQLGHYGMMESFLWGRYQWCRNVGVHIGVWVEAGRRQGFVRPIIGFDWKINERWHINAVYPVDTSVVYYVTPALSLAIAGRPNRTRLRFQDDDPVPQGLIEYRMWGVEGRATYEPSMCFKIEGYIGSTIWSFIKVNDSWNKRILYSNFKDTYYAGGQISLSY